LHEAKELRFLPYVLPKRFYVKTMEQRFLEIEAIKVTDSWD